MTAPVKKITPAPDTAAPPSGRDITTILEKAWEQVRAHHPDLPVVTIVTGSATVGEPGYMTWGHHWPGRWHHEASGQVTAELFIAGELFNDGGARILQTILHEAAHALAHVRRITDTCDENNRYHNKEFLKLAREVGLAKPEKRDKKKGFSAVKITEATKKRYAALIAELDSGVLPYLTEPFELPGPRTRGLDLPEDLPAINPFDPGLVDDDGGQDKIAASRSGKRRSVQCACPSPRKLSITPAQLEEGPILCGLCLKRFTVTAPDGD